MTDREYTESVRDPSTGEVIPIEVAPEERMALDEEKCCGRFCNVPNQMPYGCCRPKHASTERHVAYAYDDNGNSYPLAAWKDEHAHDN